MNTSKVYKDGAVTYYPHGLQPNMYSSCAVWSITFHIYVQSNLFVLAMYFDTVSNTNLFSFSFVKIWLEWVQITECTMWHRTFKYKWTSITIDYHLNGQLVSSLLIFKCPMSHGTMKYTLKAHVCSFVLMVRLLHYLYSLHAHVYTSENIISIET